MNIYRKTRHIAHVLRAYYQDSQNNPDHSLRIFSSFNYDLNYYDGRDICMTNHWMYRYIKSLGLPLSSAHSMSCFGINGYPSAMKLNHSRYKLFFTVENVHSEGSPWKQHEHMYLNDSNIDVSLGFDYISHEKYIRFPFWLMTMFEPCDTYEDIKRKCDMLNCRTNIMPRNEFCSFICRKDYFGDRGYFADEVEMVDRLSCPSDFRHNDNRLREELKNDKHNYLQKFKFNLCPENTNSPGYVTEKIFDAMKAKCVPIYWGSDNNPEPEIINKDAVIFLKLHGDNDSALKEIDNLNRCPSLYDEYIHQPVLLPDAKDNIASFFDQFERKLVEITKQ